MTTRQGMQVGILAADSMVRVPADATIHDIAAVIDDNDVGAVIVGLESVDGIVSERDLVRALAAHHDPTELRAGDIATTELVHCDAHATIDEAAEHMMSHYVRHLLVEDDGEVTGIVSARDLLGAFVAR